MDGRGEGCTFPVTEQAAIKLLDLRLRPATSELPEWDVVSGAAFVLGPRAEVAPVGLADGHVVDAGFAVAHESVLPAIPIDLPGGTKRFGTLRLRHSDHCGTDWASAYYSNRNLYTITLISFRPADGAETRFSWSNNTPPGSYGNMLSTARGCVWVQATVTTPFGASKPVRTECLR